MLLLQRGLEEATKSRYHCHSIRIWIVSQISASSVSSSNFCHGISDQMFFLTLFKVTTLHLNTSLWNDFNQFKTLCPSVRRTTARRRHRAYLERGLRDWEGLFFTAAAPLNWFRARRVTKGQQIWHVETFGSWPSRLQLLFFHRGKSNMYIEYCRNTVHCKYL